MVNSEKKREMSKLNNTAQAWSVILSGLEI